MRQRRTRTRAVPKTKSQVRSDLISSCNHRSGLNSSGLGKISGSWKIPPAVESAFVLRILEEALTGVDENDGSFGDKIMLVSKVLDICMRECDGGDRSPTMGLQAIKVRNRKIPLPDA